MDFDSHIVPLFFWLITDCPHVVWLEFKLPTRGLKIVTLPT